MAAIIHIHEDDWGMRSLHPAAAWAQITADLEASIEAGRRNRAPDRIGWTDVHVIREPAVDFTSTGLRLDKIAGRLGTIMPRVTRFVATAMAGFDPAIRDPYGSYEDDAWCFGFDKGCFIKLESQDELIRRIWFEASTADAGQLSALRRAIEMIDQAAEAIIIDYWVDVAGRVRDGDFMSRYFDGLLKDAS